MTLFRHNTHLIHAKQNTLMTSCPYLVHAGLIEPHNGGVRQTVKHRPQSPLRIQLLRLEELLQELLIEHGGDYVIHDCRTHNG